MDIAISPADAETVGRMVREAREGAGLTQTQLADRLGTHQSVISRWERGGDEPRLSSLVKIMRACGLSLHLSVEPDDVDRAQIRQQLTLTPAQRLASVTNVSRTVSSARRLA